MAYCLVRRRAWLRVLGGFWLTAGLLGAGLQCRAQGMPVAVQVSPSTWYVQGASALGSPQNRNFISNAGFVRHGGVSAFRKDPVRR